MLESETRKYIDQKLQNVWYNLNNQIGFEYALKTDDTTLFIDYVIYSNDGQILALIEAKRFERSAKDGKFQALQYAEILEWNQWFRPFIFLSNSHEIFFYNSTKDQSPRKIKTFYSIADLLKLKELQKIQLPPTSIAINTDISGRHYQMEAIKKVVEGIENYKREFLLVMATWTGKTRTSMWLIDVMIRSKQAQKILFLSDRTALRDQAFDDGFKVYFPQTPKSIILWSEIDPNARLYSATYQTMINHLDSFSSGFFDMIIVDEVHRSIYGEWMSILDHFDAIRVWLTATPLKYVDRSTYRAFWCKDEDPTYYYGYDEAVSEGYLVPYKALLARTKLQIQGIKAETMPKDVIDQLKKEWKTLDEYTFEWTDIWKKIDNKPTNIAIIKEFMANAYTLEDGLPGKTIIFAQNQAHTEHLQETFEELYPHLHNFSVVITSSVERNRELLRDFKKYTHNKKYRIAISVDMLDTGIDVPAIVNLVFARKVFSESKLWQMIGRWTRLCPNVFGEWIDRKDFYIFDFALNLDEDHKFKAPKVQNLWVNQKYFQSKIELLKTFDKLGDKTNFKKTKKEIETMIKSLKPNDDTLEFKDTISSILDGDIYDNIAINPYETLHTLTPIMKYYDTKTLDQMKFLTKIDNLKAALIKSDNPEKLKNSIANDINALNANNHIEQVHAQKEFLKSSLTPNFWQDIDITKLDHIIDNLSNIIQYKKPNTPQIIITDLEDEVIERRWIEYSEWKKMHSDKYWQIFVEQIEYFAKSSKALKKIESWETLYKEDLEELEKLFKQSKYNITVTNLRRTLQRPTIDFVSFIKFALGKSGLPDFEEEVEWVFTEFLHKHNFSSNQVRFLNIVKSLIISKKHITYEDLYSDSFENTFGMWAFDRLFSHEEQESLMEVCERFVV